MHQRCIGIVGALGYLVTVTHLDLAWAYSELCKYVQFLGKNHMLTAEQGLSYLCSTWNRTIRYSTDSHQNPNILWGWVNADWARDTDTRESYTGYILMMNGGSISWKSRRQDNVLLSTSKTKFVAPSQAGPEAIYLRETLDNFRLSKLKPLFSTKTTLPAWLWAKIQCAKDSLVILTFVSTMCNLPSPPEFVGHSQIMTGHVTFATRLLCCVGGYYLWALHFCWLFLAHLYFFPT